MNGLPTGAKAAIERRFRYLETQSTWQRPDSAKLKGYHYIHEIRIKWQKNQCRPLGFFSPNSREFILLIGAVEKGSKFEPKNAPIIAENRRKKILVGKNNARTYFI